MKRKKIQGSVLISDDNPLLREHRLHGIHILPGVSMLDVIYKTLEAAGYQATQFLLKDILFHAPVVTREEMSRSLSVIIELGADGGQVSIFSRPVKDGVVLAEDSTTHLSCSLKHSVFDSEPIQVEDIRQGVDLDTCYQVTRQIGIQHDDFMKCRGQVQALPDGGCVARVELGERARQFQSDFLLHPVFLDCSTVVPLFQWHARLNEAKLFIPFGIEEFQATSLKGHDRVLVVATPSEDTDLNQEMLKNSFAIYTLEGYPLVRFKNFAVKRVWSLEKVRRLLDSGGGDRSKSASVSVAENQTLTPAVAVEQLVRTQLEQHGDMTLEPGQESTPFFDLGLDSLALLDMAEALEERLGVQLYPTLLFEHASLKALSAYLQAEYPAAVAKLTPHAETHPETTCKLAADESDAGPNAYLPRWQRVSSLEQRCREPAAGSIALLGTTRFQAMFDAIEHQLGGALKYSADANSLPSALTDICKVLTEVRSVEQLWCLGIDHGVLFRLLQILIHEDRLSSPLHMLLITSNAFSVFGETVNREAEHGVWGLLQSASREYPELRVSQVDLSNLAPITRDDWAWLKAFDSAGQPRQMFALRQGRCYQRRLFPARSLAPGEPPWREGGVYLIIGGGGGIGLALLNRLCSRFGAKVAVMGRRPDVEVSGYMAMTEQFGNQLLYLQGHVNDEADLQRVLGEVREHFGRLDGVIHAAMVLQDKRLADMSEADFQKVLEPKVAGIQALSKAVQTQRLDFLLVFSSLQSFVGNVAQGNYATASTYLDGYACAMRQSCSFPVFVVNWGVWGEVGAVATEAHRQLLARQGMICMATEDAFNWLEKSLAAGWQQTVIAAAQAEVLEALGCVENQEILTREPAFRPEAIDPPGINWSAQRLRDVNTEFTLIKDAIDRLVNLALRRIAAIFRDELKLTRERSVWRKAGILEEYQALVAALFDLLPERLAEVEALPQEAFEAAVDELNRKFELLQPFAGLLSACMAAYSDVLTGKVRAADVVFPQGRIDAVRAVYADTAVCGFYNNLVAELATECADQLDRPLRILEIGAGTGATTQAVADRLNRLGKRYEYHYTELWDVLLEDAKLRLADDYPEVSFGFLDINFDPRDQGYSDPFDVVIATNVLHATRNLAVSLQNVKLLLSSGGRLLLNESLEVQAYSTLIFGLLPGWWHATDVAERLPNSPLVSRQGWKTLLREAGFSAIGSCLPSGCDAGALGAQDVFHAVSDGEALVARTTKRHRQAAASDITFRHSASLGLPDALPPMMEPVPWTDLGMSSDVAPSCLKLYRDPHRNLWLFLDNPPANFFTDKCLGELCSVLDALQKNPGLLHKPLLYISHFGNYFSLGGERSQIASWVSERRTDALRAFAEKARQLLVAISTLEAVVIAVVDGTAQGGGFETLLAADLQVVRKGVALGLSEIKSGLVPGMGGMSYLQSQIGMASLKRILICGSSFSAQEAYALGLISHLADDPFTDALTLGEQLDHLQTAVLIKQRLNQNASEALTADIDYWLEYLLRHSELIDEKRIESSEFVVANQAVQATNYSTI